MKIFSIVGVLALGNVYFFWIGWKYTLGFRMLPKGYAFAAVLDMYA